MYDAEAVIRREAGRNTVVGNYNTNDSQCIPDQTKHNMLLKEIIELRAIQNSIKNKLRKVLFAADKGKSIQHPSLPGAWALSNKWLIFLSRQASSPPCRRVLHPS